jgi:shikimate 5-dehydrogenase
MGVGDGFDRMRKTMSKLEDILTSTEDIDDRLTPGQMHAAAVESLGCEPIVFVCNIIAMAMDARAKLTVKPEEAARIGLAVMDRLYGPPDTKTRKKANSENQFELEFAWQMPQGEVTAVVEGTVS